MAVSEATKRNWKKLNTGKKGKLLHGANKSSSGKSFYPLEYVTDPESTAFLDRFTSLCRKDHISRKEALFSLALLMLEKIIVCHRGSFLLPGFSGMLWKNLDFGFLFFFRFLF